MKRLLFALLLVLLPFAAMAQGDQIISPREAIHETLRANTFDNLVRKTYCAMTTAQYVTPNDIVSTYTYGTAYLSTYTGPLLLRVQNLGTTAKIHYKEYSTDSTSVSRTANTDSYLESKHGNYLATCTSGQLAPGEVWEKVFYGKPDLTFGGVEAATFTIEVYKRKGD